MYINKTVSGGRPETDVIVMFKMLVLQQWHELSDFELEKQCINRISFRKFLGFPEYIPESTTVWLFRERIIENFKEEGIWGKLQSQLDALGLQIKQGMTQDATFILQIQDMQKQINLEEMRQKQEEAETEHEQRREVSLTLDMSFII